MNKATLSALIGLIGAVGNNEKTDHTDTLIQSALLSGPEEDLAEQLRMEKFRISPNCATCKMPCGNTSDYPMEAFENWSEEERMLKEEVLVELKRISGTVSAGEALPDVVYKAVSYIGYDMEANSYRRLLEELKKW